MAYKVNDPISGENQGGVRLPDLGLTSGSGLIAYAGSYTIDGDKVSHHVDASWNQAWTGTTQVRQFKIEGNSLHIRTMPAKNALTGRQSSSVLIWTKVE
jgi:hypothetical protein